MLYTWRLPCTHNRVYMCDMRGTVRAYVDIYMTDVRSRTMVDTIQVLAMVTVLVAWLPCAHMWEHVCGTWHIHAVSKNKKERTRTSSADLRLGILARICVRNRAGVQ